MLDNQIDNTEAFSGNMETAHQATISDPLKDNEIPPFIMTIDIDQGKSEKLKIFFDSNPDELAFDFCKRNNLDFNAMQYLSEEIKNVITNNIEPEKKKNQIQEMIKEENEEEDIQTEGNEEKDRNLEKMKEEGIKREEYVKEEEFLSNMEGEEEKKTNKIDRQEYVLQEEMKCNNMFNNQEVLYSSENYDFVTNPEVNNRVLTSYENLLDKRRLNTDNINKLSSEQNFYEQTNKLCDIPTKTHSKKNSNIFEKLYRDAEIRRKLFRMNSEKSYRIKHDDSLSHLNNVMNTKKSMKVLPTQRSKERLYSKPDIVSNRNSDGFYYEAVVNTNDNCTFRPKINQNPYTSHSSLEKPSLVRNYNEYISNLIREREDELKEIREKYSTEEIYSFSPKINNKSQDIMRAKNTTYSSENNTKRPFKDSFYKSNQLYENYKQTQMKKHQMTEDFYSEYNFIPEINKNYKFDMDFQGRQEIYKRKVEEKQKETEKSNAFPIDRSSGQKLFQPKILTKISSPRKNDSNIGAYLYNFTNVITHKKQAQSIQIENEFRRNSNLVHTKEKSEVIFQMKKIKAFKRIFTLLDSDEDKEISIFCISLTKIPPRIKTLIAPIINKLKQENCVIRETEFMEFCEQIYENSTKDNKYIMLNFEKARSSSNSVEKLRVNKGDEFKMKKNKSMTKIQITKNKNKSMAFDPINRIFIMHASK